MGFGPKKEIGAAIGWAITSFEYLILGGEAEALWSDGLGDVLDYPRVDKICNDPTPLTKKKKRTEEEKNVMTPVG